MLSQEENELLARTGPGTPMGEVMRRYWLPALLSRELPEPDCPPVRVKLLGERLVAFRDTGGRVGLLEEFCAHRGASLFLGRNEEGGLRCVFHGWKYDVDGNCTDMMNEPEEVAAAFRSKVHLNAYPTVEMGGLVWAYMGPQDKRPALPRFEWTQAPQTHRHVTRVWEECNWLQALEGGIDTSHAPILHRTLTTDTARGGISPQTPFVRGKAPTLEVDITDYGYRYMGIRPLGDEGSYVRAYHYVMPFTQLRPSNAWGRARMLPGHFWVPMDDENCMVYNWRYSLDDAPLTEEERLDTPTGNADVDTRANFRKLRNRDNDWLLDRQVQRTETFTGIEGINTQDHAVQEGMGPLVDRTREHLGPADKAIIATRHLLLQAVRTVQDGGDPPGTGSSYYSIRAAEKILSPGVQERDALLAEMYPAAGA